MIIEWELYDLVDDKETYTKRKNGRLYFLEFYTRIKMFAARDADGYDYKYDMNDLEFISDKVRELGWKAD